MTKKRPRRVGLGMKPRQTPVNTAVSTELEVPVSEIEVSGTAAQEEAVKEAVVEGSEVFESGVPLAFGGVQILDSEYAEVGEEAGEGSIVAQNPVFEAPPAVPQEAFDTLADLMKKSEEANGAGPQFIGGNEMRSSIIFKGNDGEILEFDGKKTYAIGVDIGRGEDRGAAAIMRLGENGAADEVVDMLDLKPLGILPTGEFRSTVLVPEWCVEGVKQEAGANGQTIEEWLSAQLRERLELWWTMPGAK